MTEITLQLQFPLTVEHAPDHARVCVEGAKRIDDVDLDYTVESLEYIDMVIESWRDESARVEDVATVLFTLGCYLGEVFVQQADGKWVAPPNPEEETFPLLVELEGGITCRPIEQVFKRFEEPEAGDYLPDYFEEVVAESGEEKELVAVLRTLGDPSFEATVVHKKISDDLGVFACRKVETDGQVLAIDYVLKSELQQSALSEDTIIEYCFENFFAGNIEINSYEQEGDEMLSFEHDEGLVSSIIAHPSTYSQFSELLKAKDITILVVNSDSVLATKAGSSFEEGFRKILDEVKGEPSPLHLVPAIYQWSDGKLTKAEK